MQNEIKRLREKTPNEIKRIRRRRRMKLSVLGEYGEFTVVGLKGQ